MAGDQSGEENAELLARLAQAGSRAAEMEHRYDGLTLAMRDLETRLNADNARLRTEVATLRTAMKILTGGG